MEYDFNIIAKYIHGSEDSTDTDVIYVVDNLPDKAVCKQFCSEDKDENRNMITVEEGVVSSVYKGTVDEVNNALLRTYSLHEQSYPLLITRKVERDPYIKYIRSLRIILSHLSRSKYRPQIKEALRGGWNKRLEVLDEIDVREVDWDTLNKNMTGSDVKKVVAFQMGQALGLFGGNEYYTKSELAKQFVTLKPFLYREECDISYLGLVWFAYWMMLKQLTTSHNAEEIGEHCIRFGENTYDLIEEKIVEV